jgi:hypothetical protein
MKLKIYKAFKDIEMHYHNDNKQLLVFPSFSELKDCMSVFPSITFDDEGIECNIKDGYVCFDLAPILERYDIDVTEIFPPESID